MKLTRDQLRDDVIRRMIRDGSPETRVLTDAELAASRRATLNIAPAGRDVWVFGYGSLIWNPAFHFVEQRIGTVYGYHRRFCLWVPLGRGTPDAPGLMLGLEPGGCCRGVAFRIAPEAVEAELDIVWRREMVTHAYRPCWVRVHTVAGPVSAIAFAINRAHERYAGRLAQDEVVNVLATAQGALGRSADYLFSTVEHLEALGIRDWPLHRLRDAVAAVA